jgi:hypothetical protein
MFIRRLGQKGRQRCSTGAHCSQVLEMIDGDFTVVGKNITAEAKAALPPGPGIGPDECAVRVPRRVMLEAILDIPAAA